MNLVARMLKEGGGRIPDCRIVVDHDHGPVNGFGTFWPIVV
jgi:hypothetical protein